MHRQIVVALLVLFFPAAGMAGALELKPVKVGDGVYAVVGDLEGQTYKNDGLNANLGFVVGRDGVLVINTGPTRRVAEALHRAIKTVTTSPVKWVVNVNSQNHYWHGNGYFASPDVQIISHEAAVKVMRESGNAQLEANRNELKEKAAGTTLAYPAVLVKESHTIDLGNRTVEVRHFGHAHTPGDVAVWLPKEKLVFTGDIIYTERMLAVIPLSNSGKWVTACDRLLALNPAIVVPGHGRPTDAARARRDTRDYLDSLRTQSKQAFERGDSLMKAVNKIDQSKFKHLANFEQLARRNANVVFREVEKESF
ncbi:MAG: hypothetical protein A2140_09545 [Candidatus Muproteobacteria bacterium RBG_16_62_13]|uniref:Metallo-beta-lactamase domain-containing protein n=1 Tax=Candidatus Muproteobacteria bacterium RBG_16_62_13 TaxID=1817756 RepID=A0A1F6SZG3_9PROT|nr:MAG: hypothetical protein A2140_09545 [Candidatus Muproteobacteria bacterium RBG_16_62_13]